VDSGQIRVSSFPVPSVRMRTAPAGGWPNRPLPFSKHATLTQKLMATAGSEPTWESCRSPHRHFYKPTRPQLPPSWGRFYWPASMFSANPEFALSRSP
jgi:hypothetical protein